MCALSAKKRTLQDSNERITSPQKRKSHAGKRLNQWDPNRMKCAIDEYMRQQSGDTTHRLSLRGLARAWDVPYRTFRNRVVGKVTGHDHASGRPTVLPAAAESELAELITTMANVGFPLTRSEIRQLAFEYAESHGIHTFSDKKHSAGYYWFNGFMSRYPSLSVKKAENLAAGRAMAMNKVQVQKWFAEYSKMTTSLGINDLPSHLWNFDETGLQNVTDAKEVIGLRGQNTYSITALEKGETSTYLAGISAIGMSVPPMIIHKGKTVGKNWKNGAPYDTVVRASPSGWITIELFLEYGHIFLKFLKTNNLLDGRPHLVVMDNHCSHTFNLEFLLLMKKNNITIFGLSSHTSHWLQPLDKVTFGVLKASWRDQLRIFTRNSGGRALSKVEFFKVFRPCYEKAMTVEYAQSAFRATGLFPVNPQAIPDSAYDPSRTTERCLTDGLLISTEPNAATSVQQFSPVQLPLMSIEQHVPGTSAQQAADVEAAQSSMATTEPFSTVIGKKLIDILICLLVTTSK